MPSNQIKKTSMHELGRINVEKFKSSQKLPVRLVLDNIRSLQNVGSFFRTADAFRIEKIYLCGITGTPPNREIEKTALGATDSVSYEYCKESLEALKKLKTDGFTIISVEQTTESILLDQFKPEQNKPLAFIFGNEVFGVSDEVLKASDMVLEIPQFGTKHSFNVSVSAGIILWDFYLKKSLNFFSIPS